MSTTATTQPRSSTPSSSSPLDTISDPTSALLTYFSNTTTLEDLHTTLLNSLSRLGWTERVRALSLELLRSGRCQRFEEVVDAVVGCATGDEQAAIEGVKAKRGVKRKRTGEENGHVNNNIVNGKEDGEEVGQDDDDETRENGGDNAPPLENVNIRIPEAVVGEGVRFLRDALDGAFVVEEAEASSSNKR